MAPFSTLSPIMALHLMAVAAAGCGQVISAASDPGSDPGSDQDASTTIDANYEPGDEGLVAHYNMEVRGEREIPDATGNGHDALCVTICPPLGPGVDGSAVALGNGAYLQIDAQGSLLDPQNFTISVWLRVRDLTGSSMAAVSKPPGPGSSSRWTIQIDAEGLPSFVTSNGAGSSSRITGGVPVGEGGWFHLAIAFQDQSRQVYFNGQGLATQGNSIQFEPSSLWLGADLINGAPGDLFQGSVDELRIYDHALSEAAIAELVAESASGARGP